MRILHTKNDKLFMNNIDLIKDLCSKNWIPAEIAKNIGIDRHAMITRLRKFGLRVNERSCIPTDGKKVCSCCKNEKLIKHFARKGSGMYSGRCKDCRKVYLNENKASSMLSQTKNNAKQKGWDFNLTIEDIIIPEFCPILGVRLDPMIYRYSPSIDRKDPSKGYIKGNVWVISTKANNMKNDATPAELLAFAKYYINPVGTQNIINVFK